jgi:putative Mn2+ efflux pump MntP
MSIFEIVIIAFALAIDAFAVSFACATTGQIRNRRSAIRLAFHLGFFQFFMPIVGWAAGTQLTQFIAPFDHWVAFGLLLIVSIRMLRPDSSSHLEKFREDPSKGLMLVTLSVATSIDALAVGLSLAILSIGVWMPCVIIGVVALGASLAAIRMGSCLQERFGRQAEIIGAIVLMVIAVRIVLTHTLA